MKSTATKAASAQAKLDAVLDLIAVTPLKQSAADKRAEKSAKTIRDQVAAQTKPLNGTQTAAMAKSLDVPAGDVKDHVQEVTTGYQGPMKALRDRIKAGKYTKAANGQPSCGDDVAQTLGHLEPAEVIKACMIAMDIANPYLNLNIGQQSMNLRNKLRGQLKRGEIGMGVLREAVEVVIEGRPAKTAAQMNAEEAKMDKQIAKASETIDMEPAKAAPKAKGMKRAPKPAK